MTDPSKPTPANRMKRTLKVVPGAQQARAKWWRMQDRSVASRTADLRAELQALRDSLDQRIDQRLQSVDARIDLERDNVSGIFDQLAHDREVTAEGLEARLAHIDNRVTEGRQHDEVILGALREHEARHGSEPYGIREAGFEIQSLEGIGKALGASNLGTSGDQYADFLAVFRGAYERVLELMEPYGPLLAGHGPLLDIGCGRGELLDVAVRAGIEASGIDLDVELVRQANERGFTAVVGDGIAALRDAPDGSLGAVSAIHVVEHLPVDDLEAFFREARRALKPGGLLLTETINPHEVSAASTFWVDPTHRGPVFPEVSLALAMSTGFATAHVFAPDGTGDWDTDRTRSTRYTLRAVR